jgi:hypothetical protein
MVRSGSDKLFAFSGESSYFDSDKGNKEELYDLARSVVVDQVEVAPSATCAPFLVWNPEFTTGIRQSRNRRETQVFMHSEKFVHKSVQGQVFELRLLLGNTRRRQFCLDE